MGRLYLKVFLFVIAFSWAGQFASAQVIPKQYWDSAWYYYNRQNYQQTIKYWDKYIAAVPSNSEGYLNKAMVYERQRDYRKANVVLTEVLSKNEDLFEAYQRRGINFLMLNSFDSCIIDMTRIIGQSHYLDSVAYWARAVSFYNLEQFQKALADCDSAERYYKNNPRFLYDRGRVKFAMQNIPGALNDAGAAIKLAPSDPAGYKLRAALYASAGEFEKSLKDCNKVLSSQKDDFATLFYRSQCYLGLKRFNEAVNDLNQCVRRNPEAKELYFLRGTANFYLANDAQAIKDLTVALEFNPNNGLIYFMIGACRNNMKAGTGCADLRKSLSLGNTDASRLLGEECK